jgi:hypothetical protein
LTWTDVEDFYFAGKGDLTIGQTDDADPYQSNAGEHDGFHFFLQFLSRRTVTMEEFEEQGDQR